MRDALVTWNNFIIDGHNRYEIATRHGLTYNTISKEFASEDDVIIWMIDNQLARRNISIYDRSRLGIVQGEIFSRRARENIVTAAKIGASITNRPFQISEKGGVQEEQIEKPVIVPINATKEMAKIALFTLSDCSLYQNNLCYICSFIAFIDHFNKDYSIIDENCSTLDK